jgi:uncharacterized membrane protein
MTAMFDSLDLFISRPSTWRRMSGPLAFMTALLGGIFGLLFAVVGAATFASAESWSLRLVAFAGTAVGLWLLASVVIGVIAFLRANREPS